MAALHDGDLALDDLRRLGMLVFTTPFNVLDGYGDGPFDANEIDPLAPGQRPTLQGNGLSLRMNGLDAQSCNECHNIVSNRTRPPRLGIGGAGGLTQNAVIRATVIDNGDSTDPRVTWASGHDPDLEMRFDRIADFNGRYSNPPFLFGGGGVELLAREMTADLQALPVTARTAAPGAVIVLDTHGTFYGRVAPGKGALSMEGHGCAETSASLPGGCLTLIAEP